MLLNNGADSQLENNKGEKPVNLCSNPAILSLLGETITVNSMFEEKNLKYTPNYLRNQPLNGQVDIGPRIRTRHTDFTSMPTTMLPSQNDGRKLNTYLI